VTDLKEFEAQPDLERFLRKRFPVKESERYRIFDLRTALMP